MLPASAGGSRVPLIARLVHADEGAVREVIHQFNESGLACLGPQWAGGRPRLLAPDDEDFVRGPLRPTAAVHPGRLPPPQPSRADPGAAPLPALAQRQRPPPRRARRPAQGTCPNPRGEGHPLGRTPPCRRIAVGAQLGAGEHAQGQELSGRNRRSPRPIA
nr:helix-turn-helix domain-containing protein [Nocardiopsis potens]